MLFQRFLPYNREWLQRKTFCSTIMRLVSVPAFFLFALVPGCCATLALENQTAAVGLTLTASLSFSAEGQVVSGVQFDIESDSAISIRVLPGVQTGASNKVLYTTSLPDRVLRVWMIGMNRDVIGDGELLRLVISVDPTAAPGIAQIRIDNAVAADPDGAGFPSGRLSLPFTLRRGLSRSSSRRRALSMEPVSLPGRIRPGVRSSPSWAAPV